MVHCSCYNAKNGIGYSHMDLGKEKIQELIENWSNCMICLKYHNNCILTLPEPLHQYRKSPPFSYATALKWLKWAVTPSVPQSTNYSKDASSALAHSSQCYQLFSIIRCLVSLNLQPYGKQKICLLIILFQKRFHTGDTGANTGIINWVRYSTIFVEFPEAVYFY